MDGMKMENINLDIYERALKVLEDKALNIIGDLDNSMGSNPIVHSKGRIKKLDSIKYKLEGDGLEFNNENIRNCLKDVVGYRFVCCSKNDLMTIINLIHKDPDIIVDKKKDFISEPKDSGYMSYHMIVKVPVVNQITGAKNYVSAEIQIRTLAMDLWAAMHHVVCYKKTNELSDDSMNKIKNALKIAYDMDERFDKIIKRMESSCFGTRVDDFYDSTSILNINKELISSKYGRATKRVLDIVSNIEKDFDDIYIEHKKHRVKTPESICRKLCLNGYEVSNDNIDNCLSDIGGVRIVCRFRCDMNNIIQRIRENPLLNVIEEKDYVTNPKCNGYSSYHIIVEVPVGIGDKIEKAKVEIQIRTLAMDLWANLEEKICYKKNVPDEFKDLLKNYAVMVCKVDEWFDDVVKEFNHSVDSVKVKKLVKDN